MKSLLKVFTVHLTRFRVCDNCDICSIVFEDTNIENIIGYTARGLVSWRKRRRFSGILCGISTYLLYIFLQLFAYFKSTYTYAATLSNFVIEEQLF